MIVLSMYFGVGFACISDFIKSAGPVRSRSHRYRKRHKAPVANGHGAASGEGETLKSDAMCKKLKIYDGAEFGKNLQAIRMADVKAITDCRTLTLQAEDFVELLLVA
jgi:hypothetical protein